MKSFNLKKEGAIRLNKGELDLGSNFLEESIKSCIPGELIQINDTVKKKSYFAFANPLAEGRNEINLINNLWGLNLLELDLEEYILKSMEMAIRLRENIEGYQDNSRLFYGSADGLPGLVVDSYTNYVVIQINSAGVDQKRIFIKETLQKKYPTKKIILLDNEKYREKQGLPIYEKDKIDGPLEVLENGFKYQISANVIQKVGYYYDHRENRKKAENFLKKFKPELNLGLDLFSYVGSWGLHLLRGGVKYVDFVDQGNFQEETNQNLKLNQFDGRGTFYRENVFKFLDKALEDKKSYDVICSDPPAFAKSIKEKKSAIDGYTKLHRKVLRLCASEAVFIAASCTHYVSHEEFQKTVKDAAFSENVNITLLDMGAQAMDHPNDSTSSYSNYIKFYLYLVRKR